MALKLPSFELGVTFGEWTVIEQLERQVDVAGRRRAWFSRVRCVCGTEKILANSYLRAGHSKGCGCRRGRLLAKAAVKHDKSRTVTYRLWQSIKQRLKTQRAYAGVELHEPWITDFVAFETFIESLGPRPTPEHTLDRINPSGHYEPGNLRWADKTTQSLNRRNSMVANLLANGLVQVGQKHGGLTVLEVMVIKRHGRNWYGAKVRCDCGTVKTVYQKQLINGRTRSCGCFRKQNIRLGHKALEKPIAANGRTMSMSAWARATGISKHVIWQRIHKYGWEPARAVTEPADRGLRVEVAGETLTLTEWARRHAVPGRTIKKRLAAGWDPFEAVTVPVRPWARKTP